MVEYKFFEAVGQAAFDQVSSYHAVSGNSLGEDISDVIWTDRGAYFSGSSVVTLPPNSIVKEPLLIPKDFIIDMWVFPKTQGQLYSKFGPSNPSKDLISFYATSSNIEGKYLDGDTDFSTLVFRNFY